MRSIQRVGAATLFLRGTLGSPRNDASPARRVAPSSSSVPSPRAPPAPAPRVPHRRAFTVAASGREMGAPAGRGEGARAGGLAGIGESDPRRPRGPNARAPPPGATSDAAMPAGGTAAMTHSDDDDDDGATSGTPALAVERLLALEREGLKFHQMRERCRAILAAPGVHVPSFAADALDILAKEAASGRTSSSSAGGSRRAPHHGVRPARHRAHPRATRLSHDGRHERSRAVRGFEDRWRASASSRALAVRRRL